MSLVPVIEDPSSQRTRKLGTRRTVRYPLHFTASLTFTHFVTLLRVFARIAITACITCRDWKTDILLGGAHTDGERDNITVYINVLVMIGGFCNKTRLCYVFKFSQEFCDFRSSHS